MPIRSRFAALLVAGIAATIAAVGSEPGANSSWFDSSVSPCSDFFQYANGGWLHRHPIPADYGRWGIDEEIEQRNLAILRRIVEDAAAHPGAHGSATQLVGDFYASAIDEAAIERAGAGPLRTELDEIAALDSPEAVARLLRAWQVRGLDIAFEWQALEDLKDSNRNIAYAGQGGLGLPDRDYYLRQDSKSAQLRSRYRAHVARMLGLLGDSDARTEADWIVALETRLARASLDPVALRDPANSYHVLTLKEADAASAPFSWSELFGLAGRGDVQRFSLAQPDFFAALGKALAEVPVAHWRAYLRWHLLDDAAPYLSHEFVEADFDFRGRTLLGIRTDKPRWKRAIASIDGAIGEALGQAYVAEVMPPQARERALALVANLKAAMRARLQTLDWMSEPTKQAAQAKLDALGTKIGYPERWRDYSALDVTRASYYANIRAAVAFEAKRRFAKFDRDIDRGEWDMTPQTINAYNNPMRNEIVFPAAQLLPPYFDADADDASNYGAIGALIGHEMLHAFDDQGSKFDAHGNLEDWWSGEDRRRFDARAAALRRQFDGYVPIDALHVNGALTLGENIADLGGLLVAYDAFKATAQGSAADAADGRTPEQRFFIAYARSWREQQRPEQLRRQLQSNEHAPSKFRVNGPLSDAPAFAAAFGCKPGDAMVNPAAADVKIW